MDHNDPSRNEQRPDEQRIIEDLFDQMMDDGDMGAFDGFDDF